MYRHRKSQKKKAEMSVQRQGGKVQLSRELLEVYSMMTPKPKSLVMRNRRLIRHGMLQFFSQNTLSKKPRYFFLFHDCLLIAKKLSSKKFLLRFFVHLRSNVKLLDKPGTHEFRLLVPDTGSRERYRSLIMTARNSKHKAEWMKDLMHCLWNGSGRIGPDPSGIVPFKGKEISKAELERRREAQKRLEEEERRMMEDTKNDTSSSSSDDEDDGNDSNPFEGIELGQGDGKSGSLLIDFDPFAAPAQPHSHQPPPGVGLAYPGYQDPNQPPPGVAYGYPPMQDPNQPQSGTGYGYPPGQDPNQPPPGVAYGYPPVQDPNQPQSGVGYQAHMAGAQGAAMGGAGMYAGAGVGIQDASGHGGLGAAGMGVADSIAGMFTELEAPQGNQGASDGLEGELDQACKALEEITNRLRMKPRLTAGNADDTPVSMDDVNDAIVDGTQAIAIAAGQLLGSARVAQGERRAEAFHGGASYSTDTQFTQGLISASRALVATTKHLVSVADKVILGEASREELIASANAVSSSTTQLVMAQRSKAKDLNSEAHRRLEKSASALTGSTAALVEQVVKVFDDLHRAATPTSTNYEMTQAQVAELEAQTRILQLEADAERARRELAELRKLKYDQQQQ